MRVDQLESLLKLIGFRMSLEVEHIDKTCYKCYKCYIYRLIAVDIHQDQKDYKLYFFYAGFPIPAETFFEELTAEAKEIVLYHLDLFYD